MKEVVIVAGLRTPQGKFGKGLKGLSAVDLGTTVIQALFSEIDAKPTVSEKTKNFRPDKFKNFEKAPIEEEHQDWGDTDKELEVDEVIMGNVLQGGQGQNPARQASIYAGMPTEVPAFTVNKVCGSGMKAVTLAAEKIRGGSADAIVAGGFESMTNAPYLLPKARWGYTMDIDGKGDLKDMMVWDGLYEKFYDCHMGITAENLAEAYNISREEQERLSVESHNRALKAKEEGIFEQEIVPVETRDGVIEEDEGPRKTSLDKVQGLPTVFKKDGTITAATSSGISDGAAALMVTSKEFAEKNDLEIMAKLKEEASAGVDPQYMGLGPIAANKKLFDKVDHDEEDIDVIEENEAFAAQVLACMEETGLPKYGIGMNEERSERINPNGSGISLGHPIGATGARIIVTLLHEMVRKEHETGLATLCIGGGMGISTLFER